AILIVALIVVVAAAQQKSNNQSKTTQPDAQKSGQTQQPNQNDQGDTLPPIPTINVQLPVAVTGETGLFITDLKQSDFEIYEDNVKQEIESFAAKSDLPIDIALLMDTSASVKPKLKFERDAAVSFIYTALRARKDRALFLTFDSELELHQDFTDRLDLLTKAIDKIKARGETRLYDAIYRVCEEKMMNVQGRRRAIVLISDGEDTASDRTLKDVINIAQRSETPIFVISTKAGGFFGVEAGTVDDEGDKSLKQMAEETGGRAFFARKVIELEKNFSSIANELRSQYLIAYQPTNENLDGKFRKIEVRVPGRKDLKIRARKGYEARPRAILASQ
ncbi:MAG TPA: VWA domain-containing protein, partial [Blastocatellia bacterium]|nr:VWA domain-containing protein [Blastocatellia bacterium]